MCFGEINNTVFSVSTFIPLHKIYLEKLMFFFVMISNQTDINFLPVCAFPFEVHHVAGGLECPWIFALRLGIKVIWYTQRL